MKKYLLSFLLVGSMSFAQKFTIEETVTGPRKYAPTSLIAQQWRKDSKSITYLSTDFSNLLEKSAANGWKETTLATKAEFEAALKSKFSTEEFTLRTFPTSITWKTATTFETEIASKTNNYQVIYICNKQNK